MANIHLKLYADSDVYMAPSGALMDAVAVRKQCPAVAHFPFVVETDPNEEVMLGFQNLSFMRARYGIDPALDAEAAVSALETAMNQEQAEQEAAAANAISTEERTAAALELIAMSGLPDVE